MKLLDLLKKKFLPQQNEAINDTLEVDAEKKVRLLSRKEVPALISAASQRRRKMDRSSLLSTALSFLKTIPSDVIGDAITSEKFS